MTDRSEIERLLNQTGRTLEGLPSHYHSDDVHNRIKELTGVWGLWTGIPELGEHILHQSDVIKLLVGALRDVLDKQPKWISVEERLPDHNQRVLAYRAESRDTFEEFRMCCGWAIKGKITHWMPLPEPPEVKHD